MTTVIKPIKKEDQNQLTLVQRGMERTEAAALEVNVRSKADNEQAAIFCQGIRDMYKTVETERKSIAKGIDDAKKALQAAYKPTLNKLDEIGKAVKDKMARWADSEEKRLRKRQEMIDAENAKKLEEYNKSLEKEENKYTPPPVLKQVETKPKSANGQTFSKVKKFKLIDISKIPHQYLTIDTVKIRADVNKGLEIPGLYIWEENQVSIRSR